MEQEHPKWGPDFNSYFDKIDDRLEKALDDYTASRETTSIAHDGLIPLSVLETMLIVGENMHKLGYQHGNQSLPVLLHTVRRYLELNNGGVGIFDYYYGYLCMRHLMRTICIGTLIQNDCFEDFLNQLNPDLLALEVSSELADYAFDMMTQALFLNDPPYIAIYLGLSTPKSTEAFSCVGGLSFDDAEFLMMTIWNNRRQLILLLSHGMLPEFAALLFTLYGMTMFSRTPKRSKKWAHLQDLILRAYLVGGNEERETYRQMSLFAYFETEKYKITLGPSTDEEDAREAIEAYIDIFRLNSLRNPESPLAPIMLLDISNILFQFVDSFITPQLEDYIPGVAEGGLTRIWMEIDREKDEPLSEARRGFLRRYTSDIFRYLSDMAGRIQTQKIEQAFSDMFFKTDIFGLVGRVLLMITREGRNPGDWDYLREGFGYLRDSMARGIPISKELAHSNVADWIKVRDQLEMLSTGTIPNKLPKRRLIEATTSWAVFGPAPNEGVPGELCSNPRCAIPLSLIRPPGTNHACGRCFEATYCNKRCQRIHWQACGSDRHAFKCDSGIIFEPK